MALRIPIFKSMSSRVLLSSRRLLQGVHFIYQQGNKWQAASMITDYAMIPIGEPCTTVAHAGKLLEAIFPDNSILQQTAHDGERMARVYIRADQMARPECTAKRLALYSQVYAWLAEAPIDKIFDFSMELIRQGLSDKAIKECLINGRANLRGRGNKKA